MTPAILTMNAALSDLGSKPVTPKPPCPHDRRAFLHAARIDGRAQLARAGVGFVRTRIG
jgi:hypothetical protein